MISYNFGLVTIVNFAMFCKNKVIWNTNFKDIEVHQILHTIKEKRSNGRNCLADAATDKCLISLSCVTKQVSNKGHPTVLLININY